MSLTPRKTPQYYTEELTIERNLRAALKKVGVKLVMFDQVPLSRSLCSRVTSPPPS